MDAAHQLVLLASALGLLSVFAGLFSARFGTPLLLVFPAIGIVFGKDGPVGLVFNDFQAAYLIGSVALAVILFEGGLKTKRSMLKITLWPALALATVLRRMQRRQWVTAASGAKRSVGRIAGTAGEPADHPAMSRRICTSIAL